MKHPKNKRARQILHWESHLPSKKNPSQTNKGNPDRIPTTTEGIQRRGIATITPAYHLGSCSRTTPGSPYILAWTTSPSNTKRDRRGTKVCSRTPEKGHHPRIMESICSKLLLRQKERRQASTGTR